MHRRLGLVAAAALALLFTLQPAHAQLPPPEHPVFGHTLNYGSGIFVTPHAQVPRSSLFGTLSSVVPENSLGSRSTNANGSAGLTLFQFVEAGVSIYDNDSYGGFGKVQLIKQGGIFPAMSAGVVNITNKDIGRFGIEDSFYSDIENRISFYGVFTYVIGPGGRGFPSWVVVSGGWGSGLFLEDNPLFEGGGTGGVIGSVAFDFQAAARPLISAASS